MTITRTAMDGFFDGLRRQESDHPFGPETYVCVVAPSEPLEILPPRLAHGFCHFAPNLLLYNGRDFMPILELKD